MCPNKGNDGSPRTHMDDYIWDRAMEIIPHVKHVTAHGLGEPLTDPKFLERLQQLDMVRVGYGFSTNGTLLKDSTIETLSKLKNLTLINVSLDSPNREIYRRIRGANLESILRSIGQLMGSIQYPQGVEVSAVVMKSNLESLKEFPKLLHGLGIKKLVLQKLGGGGPLFEDEGYLDQKELAQVLEDIKINCKKLDIALEINPCLVQDSDSGSDVQLVQQEAPREPIGLTRVCFYPWISPHVTVDGNVFTCSVHPPDNIMGNLKKNSFDEIWNGKSYNDFRAALLDGRLPKGCINCTNFPLGEIERLEAVLKVWDAYSKICWLTKNCMNRMRELPKKIP